MLAFIRKYVTSLPVILLLGLVLLAFVITGVGDPLGGGGGPRGGELARAGDTAIAEADFVRQFERVVARARETTPGLTAQQALREGGAEQVLAGLTSQAALAEFARRHGFKVSERAVEGAIASIDAFRLGGKFDQATYERLLAARRLSERELRDGLRSELLARQLLTPVAAGAQIPREVALPYTRLLLDIHEGAAGRVPPPAVAAPTAAEVAAWYAQNKARFLDPERRGFRYALIDRAALAAAMQVTDAEVAAEYAKNREAYGGVATRRLQQVVLPDEARATAFAGAVRGGEGFAAAAARLAGASASDIALGSLSQARYAAAANPALAAQVFAAPAGGIVGPVRTDFGWNVVRVEAIDDARGKPLTAVAPLIRAKLRDSKAEAKLGEVIADIEDGFGTGESFADAVRDHGLTAATVPPVAKDGIGAALPPAAAPIVAKAFDVDAADGPSVQDLGNGQFAVLELGQVISAAPPPLARVAPRVAAALTAERRAAAAKAVADAVIADVRRGTSFAAALAARKLPPPQPLRGRRIDAGATGEVPPPIAAFLTLPAGGTRALPATDGSVTLVHVSRIVPGDVASAPPMLAATRQQLAQMAPDELSAAFTRAVERDVGVRTNPAALAAAKQRIAGDGPAQ